MSKNITFWKSKKLTPTLRCFTHSQAQQLIELFEFLDAQKCVFWAWGPFGMSNNSRICLPFLISSIILV